MAKEESQPEQERNWDGICRRSLDVTIRAVNEDARSVDVVASTTAIDSHGDILEQDWRLERYLLNPVVLWHHNVFESSRWSMGEGIRPVDLLPIGHAQNVRVENNELKATLVFGSADFNEMSERVFLGFKEGHLRAVSVGFRPGKVTEETINGGTIFRLSQNDLMEISAVPIPSNPEAVAKSIDWERDQLRRHVAAKTSKDKGNMAMTDEEKAAYQAAQDEAKSAKLRVAALQGELKSEKAAAETLNTELKAASARAEAAEAKAIEGEIDALVGKKIFPAERDAQVQLAKDIGLERAKGILDARPDIKLTDPVTDAKGAKVKNGNQAPEPVEDPELSDGSADIVKLALETPAA